MSAKAITRFFVVGALHGLGRLTLVGLFFAFATPSHADPESSLKVWEQEYQACHARTDVTQPWPTGQRLTWAVGGGSELSHDKDRRQWDGIISAAIGFGLWHQDSICTRPPLPPEFGCILTLDEPPRRRWFGLDVDTVLMPAHIDDSEVRLALELGQRNGRAPDQHIHFNLGPTLRAGDIGAAVSMTVGLSPLQLTVRVGYTPALHTVAVTLTVELANLQRYMHATSGE